VHLHAGTLDTYFRMILHMCLQYYYICVPILAHLHSDTLAIYIDKLATLAISRQRILLYISVLMSANFYCSKS
jgi:hypothetical protein